MNFIHVERFPNGPGTQFDRRLYVLLVRCLEVSGLKDFVGREQNVACFDLAALQERVELRNQFIALPFSAQPTLEVVPANLG
jgi:hypothetical protein